MKDFKTVQDQKELELMKARMDLSALMRVIPLLAEPCDCLDALEMLKAKDTK